MYNKLNDVPLPVRGLYREVTSEGVTTIEQLPRNDLKSWDFVEQVKLRGNIEFTIYCINKACESERWQFHDEYIRWLCLEPNLIAERYKLVDEDGLPLYSFEEEHDVWSSKEPVDTSTDASTEIAKFHAESAVNTRHAAIYKTLPITLFSGVETYIDIGVGRDGVLGIDNIKDAISAHSAGADIGSTSWIMADNSVEVVTIKDLHQVLINFNIRKQEVFSRYSAWRTSNRLTPFTL